MTALDSVVMHDVAVSPMTRWIFVEVRDREGQTGVGEASLQRREAEVAAALGRHAPALLAGRPVRLAPNAALPEAASISALDQAVRDVQAQQRGLPLATALGGLRRATLPLYANVNRRTRDRSPAGFAASARTALAAGHGAFKIAPFDEVTPAACRDGGGTVAMQPGLARIAAMREAVGQRPLMVDCHWRFTEAAAMALIDAVSTFGLDWLECPVAETPDCLPVLRRLRSRANAHGMRLAGCEELVGVEQNRAFAEGGAYDAMMPDAKYAGGLEEMLRIAELLRRNGVAFSPHNPSGPVCHAASLHVCAAVEDIDRLEVQFDESPLFEALVSRALPGCKAGVSRLPEGAGHGAVLDPDSVRAHRVATQRWERE